MPLHKISTFLQAQARFINGLLQSVLQAFLLLPGMLDGFTQGFQRGLAIYLRCEVSDKCRMARGGELNCVRVSPSHAGNVSYARGTAILANLANTWLSMMVVAAMREREYSIIL